MATETGCTLLSMVGGFDSSALEGPDLTQDEPWITLLWQEQTAE